MSQRTIQDLPVLPLRDGVVLPHMVVTATLESRESMAAIAAAADTDGLVLMVPRLNERYARIGTVAKVEDRDRLPSGAEVAVVRGLHRALIGTGIAGRGPALFVRSEPVSEGPPSERAKQLAREYRAVVEAIVEARGAPEVARFLRGVEDPGHLADTSGYSPDLSIQQKVEVLETVDVEARLEKVLAWARETLAEESLKDKIRSEVHSGMEKTQREFILRQQLEAIKKELGEDGGDVVAEYRRRAEEARMPDAVRREVEREIDRLERTSEQNPEHGWIRNYLDHVLDMPWDVRTDDRFDVAEARAILDEDHTGLDDVKERIIELLAVRKLRAERGADASGPAGGAIVTLVGPPGVGKTSLGESVARAMGRRFARISLGGIHDEAEIRGHRRTYVGAMPGRIARALKEAGTKNPVIMLDEVDKVGSDWRGDPSSALLEVLDPAQNHTFRDHYLDVDLDLSEVLFIPTANISETIPGPLLDRMEIIRLDGYIDDEKVAIARDHLLPRQVERNGLRPDEVHVTEEAIRRVITEHTREAGVRNLERELGKVLRKAVTRITEGTSAAPITVDAGDIPAYLGKPKFHYEARERTSVPGVATGLAVTGVGGDVLFIEATAMEGEPGLTLTGQLGDVMKESGQIALSYVRAHAERLGLGPDALEERVHVHVPAGAVPKDGPSAGVAIASALASLFSGRPVRSTVGMTGEITLQGKVLPVGGIKQKVLAARRAGLTDVILPARNEADLDDLPAGIREEMTLHLVSGMDEVFDLVLEEREPAAA